MSSTSMSSSRLRTSIGLTASALALAVSLGACSSGDTQTPEDAKSSSSSSSPADTAAASDGGGDAGTAPDADDSAGDAASDDGGTADVPAQDPSIQPLPEQPEQDITTPSAPATGGVPPDVQGGDPEDALQGTTTTVLRVVDGNTLVVAPVEGVLKAAEGSDGAVIDLQGTTVPEGEACGAHESQKLLSSLAPEGSPVTIAFDGGTPAVSDQGAYLAHVSTPDIDDLGLSQVSQGMASTGAVVSTMDAAYNQALSAAQRNGAGLWSQCGTIG